MLITGAEIRYTYEGSTERNVSLHATIYLTEGSITRCGNRARSCARKRWVTKLRSLAFDNRNVFSLIHALNSKNIFFETIDSARKK